MQVTIYILFAISLSCFLVFILQHRISLRFRKRFLDIANLNPLVSEAPQSSFDSIRSVRWLSELVKPSKDVLDATRQLGLEVAPFKRIFIIAKVFLGVIAIMLFWPKEVSLQSVAILIVMVMLFEMLPDQIVKHYAKRQLSKTQRQLPDFFDLVALSLEAGMSVDAALKRVGSEFTSLNVQISKHTDLLCQELTVLNDRKQAFSNLAKRLPLDDLNQLSWLIVQADEYGTPLASALKELATHSRQLHELQVEESAGKVPSQMAIPLMIFIILPLVILLAGPAVILLIRQLNGHG